MIGRQYVVDCVTLFVKSKWVMIGRQYVVDWVILFVKRNWVVIGRQYMVDWVILFVKSNWVMICRQYMVDWVTILVSGTYCHYHYIVLLLLLVTSLCSHPQPIKLVMGPDKKTVITVTASSIPRCSLARNNHNMLAFINVDVDVDDVDTRRTPM
jgi:hypothetical protein